MSVRATRHFGGIEQFQDLPNRGSQGRVYGSSEAQPPELITLTKLQLALRDLSDALARRIVDATSGVITSKASADEQTARAMLEEVHALTTRLGVLAEGVEEATDDPDADVLDSEELRRIIHRRLS